MKHNKLCEIGRIGSTHEFPRDQCCMQQAKHSIRFKSATLLHHSKHVIRLCDKHFYGLREENAFGLPEPDLPQAEKQMRFTFRENRL